MIPQIAEQAKDVSFLNWYYLTFIPETTQKALGKDVPEETKKLLTLISQLGPATETQEWDWHSSKNNGEIRFSIYNDFFNTSSILDKRVDEGLKWYQNNETNIEFTRRKGLQYPIFAGYSFYAFNSLISSDISKRLDSLCKDYFNVGQSSGGWQAGPDRDFMESLFHYQIYCLMIGKVAGEYLSQWEEHFKTEFKSGSQGFSLIQMCDEVVFADYRGSFSDERRDLSELTSRFFSNLNRAYLHIVEEAKTSADGKIEGLIEKDLSGCFEKIVSPYCQQMTNPDNWKKELPK